jgi:hypothetical protein
MQTLLALALLAGIGGGMAWLVSKGRELERRRDFGRKVLARKQGWNYIGDRSGRIDYRFTGSAHGVDWQMWYDSDRGDKSPTPRAHWKSANLRTRNLSLLILGRRRFQLESGVFGRLLGGVAAGVVHAMSGHEPRSDKAEFYESAVEVEAGGPAFRERLTVAVAPEMPKGWLDAELQRLLLAWPTADGTLFRAEDSVEITLRADGLQIAVDKMPQDTACWVHLATLGEHLARRLVAAGTAGGDRI